MENYIQNIELINQYLNKTLSKTEIQDFEIRLKTDSDFNMLYDEHTTFLEGLKRQELKTEIVRAKQSFTTAKWMRFFGGGSIIVLAIVAVVYILVSKPSTTNQNNNEQQNSIVVDSVSIENPIKNALEDSTEINKATVTKDSLISKKEVIQIKTSKPFRNEAISFIKPPQRLKINTQKDTSIVCNEGTKLKIKAHSFIDSNGNLVKGIIDLYVTEYYKLSDMLLANLSTTSDGKPLETGGMLNIEAFKEKASLKLKSSIEVTFPRTNKKEGMQLFSGEWENRNVNWKFQKEIEKESIIEDIEVEEVEEDIEVPYAVIEEVPIYPGCENGSRVQKKRCTSAAIQEFVQRNFNTSISQGLRLSGRQRINVIFKIDKFGNTTSIRSRGSHPLIEQEANRVVASLPKMTPGKQRGRAVTVPYSLPIIYTISDAKEVNVTLGEINNAPINNQVEYDTLYVSVRGQVEQIKAVMHDKYFEVDSTFIKTWETYTKQKLIRVFGATNNQTVILRKPLFEKENTQFKILEDDSISRGGHVIRKVWDDSLIPATSKIMRLVPKPKIIVGNELVTEETLQKRLENANDNKTITTKAINSYAMQILNLGWINLDRFVRNGNVVDYKIKVKNRDGRAKVSMVFKSLSSILPSRNIKGHIGFGNVLNNEDVILVAIKKQSGKLYLDIIDTNTEQDADVEFNFKEVSLEELKNELQKLNNLF